MNYRVSASEGLNIRSGPGTNFEDIGTLANEAVVISPETADWLPILLEDNTIGWVARQYLKEAPKAPEAPAPPVGGYDFSTREGTIEAIAAECRKQGLGLPAQIAYVLATTEWETGRTFKPVKEAYWLSEEWREQNLRYFPFYGRGFVQLTWEANYRKYSEILDVDLVDDPDKALDPAIALFILVHGFRFGTFTGKKLSNYVNETETDFSQARRCINGLDRAQEIATLAEKYLEAA
jgi:hypothetical protein